MHSARGAHLVLRQRGVILPPLSSLRHSTLSMLSVRSAHLVLRQRGVILAPHSPL